MLRSFDRLSSHSLFFTLCSLSCSQVNTIAFLDISSHVLHVIVYHHLGLLGASTFSSVMRPCSHLGPSVFRDRVACASPHGEYSYTPSRKVPGSGSNIRLSSSPSVRAFTVSGEGRLIQWFRQDISRLVLRLDRMNRDNPSIDIRTEMPQFVVQVFCTWSVFVGTGYLNCPAVVFKDFAMHFHRTCIDFVSHLFHFL